MFLKPWLDLFRNILPQHSQRHSRRQRGYVPQTEAMEERVLLATRIWDGGGTSNNMSEAANWSGDTLPANNGADDVIFPAAILNNRFAPVFDLGDNFAFRSMRFVVSYSLTSSAANSDVFVLTAGTNALRADSGTTTMAVGINVTANSTFVVGAGATLNLNAPVDAALGFGVTLGINSSGGSGIANLNSTIGATGRFVGTSTSGNLTAFVNNGGITTTGSQTYNGPLFLGADTTFASTSFGNIAFNNTVDSVNATTPRALTVNTRGTTQFGDNSGTDSVGGTFPLSTFQTDVDPIIGVGGGTLLNSAGVTNGTPTIETTMTQTYNDAVRVGVNSILTSRGPAATAATATILFNSTVDSNTSAARGLTVNSPGRIIFGDANAPNLPSGDRVGGTNPLSFLTIDSDTSIDLSVADVLFRITGSSISTASVRTTGNQTYNRPVLLDSAALPSGFNRLANFTSTAGGDIVFNNTVNSLSPGGVRSALVVSSSGNKQFNNFVGRVPTGGTEIGIESVRMTGGGTTTINVPGSNEDNPAIRTQTFQVYDDAVRLDQDTVLRSISEDDGNIVFNSTINAVSTFTFSAESLLVQSPATTRFGDGVGNDAVGGVNPLFTLETDDDGRTTFNAAGSTAANPTVTTIFDQTYDGTGFLQLDSVFTTTFGGDISFLNSLDSFDFFTPRGITLNTLGDVFFGDGANDDRVGAVNPLAFLITDTDAGIGVGGATVFNVGIPEANVETLITFGFQTYNDAVEVAAETSLVSLDGADVSFRSRIDSFFFDEPHGIGVTTAGITRFGDGVGNDLIGGFVPINNLTTDPTGSTLINISGATADFPTINTTGTQVFSDVVRLQTDTFLLSTSTGGAAVVFNNTVDSYTATPRLLDVNTLGSIRVGDGVGNDRIGNKFPLTSVNFRTAASGDAFSGTVFKVLNSTPANPTIKTTGSQTYVNAIVELNSVLVSTGGTAPIAFLGGINSQLNTIRSLAVNTGGTTTFGNGGADSDHIGLARALLSLTTDAPGTTIFRIANTSTFAPTVTTTGLQSYGDVVRLRLDGIFKSTLAGNLTFLGQVDSFNADFPRALEVNTLGTTTFGNGQGNDRLGNTFPLASLRIDADGFQGTGGKTVFNIAGATNAAPTVKTIGLQNYNDILQLRADTVFTSTTNGDVAFHATVDSFDATARNLTINTGGRTDFGDGFFDFVGDKKPLASVTTDAAGQTRFGVTGVTNANPSLTTTGRQTYNDLVVLLADTILSSTTNAPIQLNGGLLSNGFSLFFSNNPDADSSLSGFFNVGGGTARLFQSGNQLTFVDQFNNRTTGTRINATTVTGRGGLTGTLQNGDIVWSDGVTWDRIDLSANYIRLSDNVLFKLVQTGTTFKLTDPQGNVTRGVLLSPIDFVLTGAISTTGLVNNDRLILANGDVLVVRPPRP